MADIEAEREMSRSDVAEYLRTFANKLDASTGTDTKGTGSSARTSDSNQRESDSHQRDDTVSNDNAETGTGNSDTTGDSNTTGTSSNDTNENTTDDDYATDVEQRNRDDSSGSDASGGRVTFMVGNESTTINPPENVTFEVSVDSDSSLIGSGTGRTAHFAIHWDESDVADDEGLSIQ